MHEQHLPVAHDEAAGGADDRQIVLRSFCHAFGHAALAVAATLLLALDETAGDERLSGRRSDGELAQPLRGDHGVLVLAEDVLQLLGPLHELLPARELGRVPRALALLPHRVQLLVRRLVGQLADGLANLGGRLVDELVEGDRRIRSARAPRSSARCRRAERGTRPTEAQRAGGCGCRSARCAAPRAAPAAASRPLRRAPPPPPRDARAARRGRAPRRGSGPAPSAARRARRCRSRPAPSPARSRARRRRTPTRMSWRLSGSRPSRVPGSCRSISRSCSRRRPRSSSNDRGAGPYAGRRPSARNSFGRPCPCSAPAETSSSAISIERVRTAVAKLDLDLDELVALLARIQHRDLVRCHLGRRPVARDELAAPVRSQLRDALERPAPQMSVEEGEQLLGRLSRPALGLELETRRRRPGSFSCQTP